MHCYVKVVITGIIHNFSLLYNCTKSTLGGVNFNFVYML